MENVFYFKGHKTTREDFIAKYELGDQTPQFQDMVIQKLVDRGEIKFPEKKGNGSIEAAMKEVALDEAIERLQENPEFIKGNRYPKVELDLLFNTEVDTIASMLNDAGIKFEVVKTEECFIATVYDITEKDLSVIKKQLNAMRTDRAIRNGLTFVADNTVDAVNFATGRVVVPVAKAAVKTGVGATKTIVRSGAAIGSTLISSTSSGIRSLGVELKRDEDVLKAKQEMITVKNGFKKLFGKSRLSMGDSIRVID